MDVTAENLANADTTQSRQRPALPAPGGGAGAGRHAATSAARSSGAMAQARGAPPSRAASQVAGIVADKTPDQQVYDPGNPEADAQGYVKMPNVNTVTEMTDLISESAVLPVRCDRDADRQVDVHLDPRPAQMIVPPVAGARAASCARAGQIGPGIGARPGRGAGEPAYRDSGASGGRLRRRADRRDLLAGADPAGASSASQALAPARSPTRRPRSSTVEDAAAGDAARLTDAHQGRPKPSRHLPDAGLALDAVTVAQATHPRLTRPSPAWLIAGGGGVAG